jgi:hypothetical protein
LTFNEDGNEDIADEDGDDFEGHTDKDLREDCKTGEDDED